MKLWQLLKSHLGPYRRVLVVVVVLQAIQTPPRSRCRRSTPPHRQRRAVGDNGYI